MAKRYGPKPKILPMEIGNDPALWRYASVEDAVGSNTHLLAELIRKAQEQDESIPVEADKTDSA